MHIRCDGVGYTYPVGEERVEIAFPTFELDAGEQLLIVGPSGSGKTTLLHLLAGLLVPSQGVVVVNGTSLGGLTEAQRDHFRARRVGYLFQDFHLAEGYTARDNVLLGLGLAGTRGRAAAEHAVQTLTRLGVGHRLRHTPKQLSAGERQRVALARAIAHRPQLLLADEPTAHLDRTRAAVAIDLLKEAAASVSATLVVASHDAAVIAAFPRRLKLP